MEKNDFVIICDPRYYHLLNKNKWRVLEELNDKDLKVEYLYKDKPAFVSDFCKKHLPKIEVYKPNILLLNKLLKKYSIEIRDKIISYLSDKYVTRVEKRFCRNSNNKWIIKGDRYFYDPEYYKQQSSLYWRWFGGEESNGILKNIGWVEWYRQGVYEHTTSKLGR